MLLLGSSYFDIRKTSLSLDLLDLTYAAQVNLIFTYPYFDRQKYRRHQECNKFQQIRKTQGDFLMI